MIIDYPVLLCPHPVLNKDGKQCFAVISHDNNLVQDDALKLGESYRDYVRKDVQHNHARTYEPPYNEIDIKGRTFLLKPMSLEHKASFFKGIQLSDFKFSQKSSQKP